RRPGVAGRWTFSGNVRSGFEPRQSSRARQTVRNSAGPAWCDDERSLQDRSPSDVSRLRDWRHRVQLTGMELQHGDPRDGRVGIPTLSNHSRGADPFPSSQLADVRCLSTLPPASRPLVDDAFTTAYSGICQDLSGLYCVIAAAMLAVRGPKSFW